MTSLAIDSVQLVARRCGNQFATLAGREDFSRDVRDWAGSQAARMRIWTATLGVFARGRMSIAYRLRLNVPVTSMILQLLEGIEHCLDTLVSWDRDQSTSSKVNSKHKFMRRLHLDNHEASTPEQSTADVMGDAKANLDILLDIAADLRKLGTQREEYRALKFDPTDDKGNSLTAEFKQYALVQCRLHLRRTRNAVVAEDGSKDSEKHHIISEKFANIQICDSPALPGNEMILDRLQATILQRWRLLCYRSHHGRALATDAKSDSAASEVVQSGAPVAGVVMPELVEIRVKSLDKSEAPRTIISSAATELTAARMIDIQPVKEPVVRSVATRSSGIALKDVDFPRQPRADGEETLCPLCWIPMPTEDIQGRRWKSVRIRMI
jgi:hypothetical protein